MRSYGFDPFNQRGDRDDRKKSHKANRNQSDGNCSAEKLKDSVREVNKEKKKDNPWGQFKSREKFIEMHWS